MSVCSDSRATSNLLLFNASKARSKSTLSGCLESTLASGFDTFLFEHAVVRTSTKPNSKTTVTRCFAENRFMTTSKRFQIFRLQIADVTAFAPTSSVRTSAIRLLTSAITLSAGSPRWRLSTTSQHLPLDHHSRTPRCLPQEFPHLLGQSRESYSATPRHRSRCGN